MQVSKTSLFFFQLIATFVVCWGIYMLFAIHARVSMVEMVEFIIFQPLFAAIYASVTIIVCLAVGLPIRINKAVNSWWLQHQSIPLLCIALGGVLLLLSLYPPLMNQGSQVIANKTITHPVPNHLLSISGWFCVAFSLLHYYPGWVMRRLVVLT